MEDGAMRSHTEQLGDIVVHDLELQEGAKASRTVVCDMRRKAGGVHIYVDVDANREAVAISLIGTAPLEVPEEKELCELARTLAKLSR